MANTEANLDRMVERVTAYGLYDFQVTEALMIMLEDWNPYRRWLTMASITSDPGEDYYFLCYECFSFMHVALNPKKEDEKAGYNILVASLDLITLANRTITEDTDLLYSYMNS